MRVDIPKHGSGWSNDGNAENFSQTIKLSEITGFNKELWKYLYVILQVLTSGQTICANKFKLYALKTVNL